MPVKTREFITTLTKRLVSGSFEKTKRDDKVECSAEAAVARDMVHKGEAEFRAGNIPAALKIYEQVADHYCVRGHRTQAVAVYKRMLQLDGNQKRVRVRLKALHKELGVIEKR